MLNAIFQEVAHRVDGAALVAEALSAHAARAQLPDQLAVLAVGKVAQSMFAGLLQVVDPHRVSRGLLIVAATRQSGIDAIPLPPGTTHMVADHPTPSARSLAAATAAARFVGDLKPADHLVVLLSGGGSSLMVAPAPGLTLHDKRLTLTAVARGGATIHELNTVRKHLSAIKGGRLALATRARTTVLALSDVIGNDPATIASGPFSADPTTFAEAVALVDRFAPEAPEPPRAWLKRGAANLEPETPKPGDPRLAHVAYQIIAGPDRVPAEARRAIIARGCQPGLLSQDTELPVPALAAAYGDRARREATSGGAQRILVGNGEPRIVVTGNGRGGRATHLALLMARELAGLPGTTFLAAGTDDRDGSSDASGAVVDGTTWQRAEAAGLDPSGALARNDSDRPLAALGCLIRGPGTSNLLDLHLLGINPLG